MLQGIVTRLSLLLFVWLAACDSCAPKPVLVAVVEDEAELTLQRRAGKSDWRVVRRLPLQARGIQVSANGSHLAWIEDVTAGERPLMQAWGWPASMDEPLPIGELGLARVDAPGLAVNDEGQVAWVDAEGQLRLWPDDELVGMGFSPAFGLDALVWVDEATQCVQGVRNELCSPVAQIFDAGNAGVLARINEQVVRTGAKSVLRIASTEPLLGALSPGGQVAVVHRDRTDGVLGDAVSVWTGSELKSLAKRAVIMSVDWEDETTLVVVAKTERRDIYELMLAHAPAEFGGQSTAGTALVIGADGVARTVVGLKEGAVRLLRRKR